MLPTTFKVYPVLSQG